MNNNKCFIEESSPVKEVSMESACEKNIRHGHISTLHIWWARRPLASSRATNDAALIPAPENIDEWQKKRDFIIRIVCDPAAKSMPATSTPVAALLEKCTLEYPKKYGSPFPKNNIG